MKSWIVLAVVVLVTGCEARAGKVKDCSAEYGEAKRVCVEGDKTETPTGAVE